MGFCTACKHVTPKKFAEVLKSTRAEGIDWRKPVKVTLWDKNTEYYKALLADNEGLPEMYWDPRLRQTTKGKIRLVEKYMISRKFLSFFLDRAVEFRKHNHIMRRVFKARRECRENLPDEWALMYVDFAEDVTEFTATSAQSAYFGRDGYTLHPMFAYYKHPGEEQLRHYPLIIVSDGKKAVKKPHMIWLMFGMFFDFLKKQGVVPKTVIIWSDNCPGQYKCNQHIADCGNFLFDFGISVVRCYCFAVRSIQMKIYDLPCFCKDCYQTLFSAERMHFERHLGRQNWSGPLPIIDAKVQMDAAVKMVYEKYNSKCSRLPKLTGKERWGIVDDWVNDD
jgi:hypothetical protein